MNHNTYGDFLGYQECPGMTFDFARRHKILFEEVAILKIFNMLSKSRRSNTCGVIQNLRWIQVESTLRIMRTGIENYSFGYDLTIGDFVKRGLSPCCVRTP